MSSTNAARASAANDDPKDSAAPPVDQDQLSVDELAERVLARKEMEKPASADGKKKKKKKTGGKKRKLARIPGQKSREKA